jgi:hypothetical protein
VHHRIPASLTFVFHCHHFGLRISRYVGPFPTGSEGTWLDDPAGVDHARDEAEQGEEDINEQVPATTRALSPPRSVAGR